MLKLYFDRKLQGTKLTHKSEDFIKLTLKDDVCKVYTAFN